MAAFQGMIPTHRSKPLHRAILCIAGAVTALCVGQVRAAEPFETPVWVWDPPFNTDGQRTKQSYRALDKVSRKWTICVLFPHLKDDYWLAVNFGMVDEAKRENVRLRLYEAGGYGNLDKQIEQIQACAANKVDALIIGAISATGLNTTLDAVRAAGIPVVDLINGISSPSLSAKATADFYDSGYATGKYLVERHKDSKFDVNVLWFPGPQGAGWVERGDKGFRDAIAASRIRIVGTQYGDTGKAAQEALLERALDAHPDVDYIVGTAVTAEAAVDIVRTRRLVEHTRIAAYYFSPGIYQGLKRGRIIAAATDLPAVQGRIALDQALRTLEGAPVLKHVGPQIVMVDKKGLSEFVVHTSLAPKGFRATFDLN